MSYGSTALASTAIASIVGAKQTFFSNWEELDVGTYRRTAEYFGDAEWYEVIAIGLPFEPPRREIRIYTHNDPGETPQLQVMVGEAFYSQSIVGAARFIVVELEILALVSPLSMDIYGNEYFQNN
jgi:hypothetical protein